MALNRLRFSIRIVHDLACIPAGMSHDDLAKLIYPAKGTSESKLILPYLLHFDTGMRKPGVMRQLLRMEYKAKTGELAMGYSLFFLYYQK